MNVLAEATALDFSGLITALEGAITAQQLIGYFAAIIAAGIGMYVAYVVVRKAIKAFTRAIKGKAPTV